jgi:hypothetical protein
MALCSATTTGFVIVDENPRFANERHPLRRVMSFSEVGLARVEIMGF